LTSPFSEKRVRVGERTLTYLEAGRASDATPIVFLHGWGISTQPYREVLELLAQQQRIIAPDLPGLGGSSSPQFLDRYSSYAELLIGFLNVLQLEQVHLIGHSLGGGISVAVAALAPDRLRSIVLVNSTGIPIGSVPEVLMRRAIEMPLQVSLPKLRLQFVDIPQVFLHNLAFRLNSVVQALLIALQQDLRPLLRQISAPCLLLWSAKDLTTPLSTAQEFESLIKTARLIVVEEGFHEWCLLYPEKFAAIVLEYVREIEALPLKTSYGTEILKIGGNF
jgi:pimeloyl-ACP methyl ester carboxylesterase